MATIFPGESGTETVAFTKALPDGRDKGPVIIKLNRQDGRWLVRDVDFKTDEIAKSQLTDFLKRFPDAKGEVEKK